MGSCFLLQGIVPTQGLNPGLLGVGRVSDGTFREEKIKWNPFSLTKQWGINIEVWKH